MPQADYKYGPANPAARHPTESLDYAEGLAQLEIKRQELVLAMESMIGKSRDGLIESCVNLVNMGCRSMDERKKAPRSEPTS